MAAVALALLVAFSGLAGGWSPAKGLGVRAATTARVYFAPDPVEIGIGLQRNVHIMVENVEGLYAVEVRIAFPNSLAQVVDADPTVPDVQIQPGDIFSGFETYLIQNNANNATGFIEYIISITASTVGKNGSGIIATIPLQGLAIGHATLSFIEVILCEQDGTSIPVNLGTGQTDVDVVTHTSTPTPTGTRTVSPTATFTPGPSVTPTPPVLVRVVPASQQVAAGNTTIVQVEVVNVQDLFGFDIRLTYNGARLDAEDADPGLPGIQVYLGNAFDGFTVQVLQNQVQDDGIFGQVQMVCYLDSSHLWGFDGTGILFWIVFRGVTPGMSNITLSEVQLVNHSGTGIPRLLEHGQVEVLAGTPTTTPTPTFTLSASLTPTASLSPTPTFTPSLTATPTVTGTLPTATFTPEATVSPTLTPSPTGALATPTPVCHDVIQNGGFETRAGNEAPPWVRSTNVVYTSVEMHTGLYSAWLGGYNNADDMLYQEVTIPSRAAPDEVTQVLLSYWWGMVTEEPTHAFDFLRVRIRNTGGALLQELQVISDGSVAGMWQYAEFDLSAYVGQTIRISFEATTDGDQVTSFFVDDVQLIVCEILQPTATPTATDTPTISPTPTQTGLPTATPTISPTPVVIVFQYKEGEYEGCYDSYLTSWEPTSNFGNAGALSIRTAGVKRPIIYFNVSSIPAGATILNARLQLYTSHYKSHAQNMTAQVYGLKRPWQEMQVTWNKADNTTNWTLGGAEDTTQDRDATPSDSKVVSAINTWYNFDVTNLVQQWVSGARPNHGMLLIATGNTVEMSFWSSEYSVQNLRPKLMVEYIMGAVGPTNTPVTVTPGASPTPTATPTTISGQEMIFQQGYLDYTGTTDTHISQWEPNNNYGNNVTLAIRQGNIRSALLRFDLSALPAGANVIQAKLGLYALSQSNPGGTTITAYQVLRPWAEGQATWFLATSATPWGSAGCNQVGTDRAGTASGAVLVNTINAWHELDITDLVRAWVADPSSNQGVLLKAEGATSVEYTYASSEYWWSYGLAPRLVVRFTGP